MRPSKRTTAAWLLAAASLTGCANLEPVATLGTGTSALASSFRPLVNGIERTCVTRRIEQDIRMPGNFDRRELQDDAKRSCKPIADAKETAFLLSTTVDGYGAAPVSLAGFKPDALSPDIGSLANAAAELNTKNGDAFFDANVLSFASKLASGIVELVLQQRVKKITKKALSDAHEPLTVTVGAIKIFATRIADLQTGFSQEKLTAVRDRVVAESKVAMGTDDAAVRRDLDRAFAYRAYQPHIDEVLASIDADRNSAAAFAQACDALLAAHAEMRDRFDEMTEPDKLKSLMTFIGKVRDLRDSFQKL